ncbi:hypothetical protein J6P92_01910 [bacterium]|nr:hypothetical protein [bacterium]
MGMSASQARLLSITSRLSNNEFRAQTITNSKLRLADESEAVSDAYLEALDSKELMYMNYDDKGESSKVNLTAAALYDYAPMKNQYMLLDSAKKYLISYTDAQNFEYSNDLTEFLTCYDLVYDSTTALNDQKYKEWQEQCDRLTEEYERAHKLWEELTESWSGTVENFEIYEKFYDVVGDSRNPKSCYGAGLGVLIASGKPDGACYLHLLNHLLDYDGEAYIYAPLDPSTKMPDAFITYTTSCGDNFTPKGTAGGLGHDLTHDEESRATLKKLSDDIKNEDNKCDSADGFIPWYENPDPSLRTEYNDVLTKRLTDNILQEAINGNRKPSKYEILKSDFVYKEPDSEHPYGSVIGTKSLRQKLIDLYYIILCSGDERLKDPRMRPPGAYSYDGGAIVDDDLDPAVIQEDMYEMLRNFTEGDLKMRDKIEPPPEPELTLPPPPEPVEGIAVLRDQEKSQWYVNLWHALNGSETSNTVDPINFDNDIEFIQGIPNDVRTEYRFIVENKTKDTKQTNYKLLDQNLYTSPEWLEFALEHGIVSMQQAQYYNPDEDSNKTDNINADGFKWNTIIYTSARDIVSQNDETAIATAEIIYKNSLAKIEHEDNKLDQDLKKLDAEHNALQTEYESIKNSISKNVERSFKAFS